MAHFKQNAQRETDSITGSVYDEEPLEYMLKPHTRTYRQRKDKLGFSDKSIEKLLQRTQYLKQVEQERELVLRYIQNGSLKLSEITETVPEIVRSTLLQWIALANLSSSQMGRTEYGQEYRLVKQEGTCVLKCEDGNLVMPCYVLEFQNE